LLLLLAGYENVAASAGGGISEEEEHMIFDLAAGRQQQSRFHLYRWCFHCALKHLLLLIIFLFHRHVLLSISSYYCKPRSYSFANRNPAVV